MTLKQWLRNKKITPNYYNLVIDYDAEIIYLVYDKEQYVSEELEQLYSNLPFWLLNKVIKTKEFKEYDYQICNFLDYQVMVNYIPFKDLEHDSTYHNVYIVEIPKYMICEEHFTNKQDAINFIIEMIKDDIKKHQE